MNSDISRRPPAICFLPHPERPNWRLAKRPLSRMNWPLGMPAGLEGKTVGDLGPDDCIICYSNSTALFIPRPGVKARIVVQFQEPSALHQRLIRWLPFVQWRFYRILTYVPAVLKRFARARMMHGAQTWVGDWETVDCTKTAELSMIASAKRSLPGHELRHAVVGRLRKEGVDVAILGRGYKPFKRKSDGLAPYRYSLIIENSREQNYFTEKIVDCLLCKTVPIYWGAPNIGEFFDVRGMIICETMDEIMGALKDIGPEDYQSRRPFIEANRAKAAQYAAPELDAARIIERDLAADLQKA